MQSDFSYSYGYGDFSYIYGYGGGLFVADGGVANLDGCNVFSNEAQGRPPMPRP